MSVSIRNNAQNREAQPAPKGLSKDFAQISNGHRASTTDDAASLDVSARVKAQLRGARKEPEGEPAPTQTDRDTERLNLSAASSRLRDADVAEQMAQLGKNLVLAQSGVSIVAQAARLPQLSLNLLQ
jgi:hypothetical protein